MQSFFSQVGSKFVKRLINTPKLIEYKIMIGGLPRRKMKLYDQTGINYDKIYPTHRVIPGLPLPCAESVPSTRGKHCSYFGMASLDLRKPEVLFKMYKKTKEISQNGDEHCDFMISAAYAGFFEVGDVLISDNWSAHTSGHGEKPGNYSTS